MLPLDRLDRKLLFALDCNSRLPLSTLARTLKLGNDLVSYRIDKFIETGIIQRCSAVIDPFRLGCSTYKVYLKLGGRKEQLEECLKKLDESPFTYWLSEWYGRWDVVVAFWSPSPRVFFRMQERLLADFGELIIGLDIFTSVHVQRHPKSYLVNRPARVLPFGESDDSYKPTVLDIAILNILSKDARRPVTSISQELDSTPAKVRKRISKLEQESVIVGYRTQFDYSKVGILVVKVIIERAVFNIEIERKLRTYCQNNQHCTCYIRQIGRHLIEFELEVPDYETMHQIIDDCRYHFNSTIKSVEYLILKKDWLHRFPKQLSLEALTEGKCCF